MKLQRMKIFISIRLFVEGNAIKMASSNYHTDKDLVEIKKENIDIDELNRNNRIKKLYKITFD